MQKGKIISLEKYFQYFMCPKSISRSLKLMKHFQNVYFIRKIKTRSKGTQINFKNNQTTPLFKIWVVQLVQKRKIISFNQENYFQYFIYLKPISRSPKSRKKNIKSNLQSHVIIYFYKNISSVQNWVKTKPLKVSFISSISKCFFFF